MGIMVVRCSPFSWEVIEKIDNWSSILAASQAAITKITFSITLTFVFAASLIGISGFILLILGSWNFQKTKVRVIEKVIWDGSC